MDHDDEVFDFDVGERDNFAAEILKNIPVPINIIESEEENNIKHVNNIKTVNPSQKIIEPIDLLPNQMMETNNSITVHHPIIPKQSLLRYRNLGKSGLRVSNLTLSTCALSFESLETIESVMSLAYENGINCFELSESSSLGTNSIDKEIGEIIKRKGWRRNSFIVVVKIYHKNSSNSSSNNMGRCDDRSLSRKYIIDYVKSSLKRLQLEFIDVVLIHRADPNCPMEEVVRSLSHLISQGLIMYWGTSKWSPVEIMEAYSNCRQFNCITPIVEQCEYHFFQRDKPELYMAELYNKIGVGLMTWSSFAMGNKYIGDSSASPFKTSFRRRFPSSPASPHHHHHHHEADSSIGDRSIDDPNNTTPTPSQSSLSSPTLTHNSSPNITPHKSSTHHINALKLTRELSLIAEQRFNSTLAQLSIAWCLKNEQVNSMIIGPSNEKEMSGFLGAVQLLPKLTSSVMNEFEKLLDNRPIRPPMISTLITSSTPIPLSQSGQR